MVLRVINYDLGNNLARGSYFEHARSFASVHSVFSPNAVLGHRRHIKQWIDKVVREGKALSTYRDQYFGKTEEEAERAINREDARIRPWVMEERVQNLKWLSTLRDLAYIKAAPSVYVSTQVRVDFHIHRGLGCDQFGGGRERKARRWTSRIRK